MTYSHIPVLQDEVLSYLNLQDGKFFIDATCGEGGHSERILLAYPGVKVLAVDRDSTVLEIARKRLIRFKDRFFTFNLHFSEIKKALDDLDWSAADAVLIDLGISQYHYQQSGRGFSFQNREKLDMRLNSSQTKNAFSIINQSPQKQLESILKNYAEERFYKSISRAIIEERKKMEITYTDQLVSIIEKAVPRRFHPKNIHVATRTFQAIRIAVNDELDKLNKCLANFVDILKKGARMAVISFHSLEDRTVKQFFKWESLSCVCSAGAPICTCDKKPRLSVITKKPVTASSREIQNNPCARSAKLRVAEKL